MGRCSRGSPNGSRRAAGGGSGGGGGGVAWVPSLRGGWHDDARAGGRVHPRLRVRAAPPVTVAEDAIVRNWLVSMLSACQNAPNRKSAADTDPLCGGKTRRPASSCACVVLREMMVIMTDDLASTRDAKPNEAEEIRDIERSRLRALVGADMPVAQALHAADFQLVNPRGGILSKAEYLGAIASGGIDYRQFEPVSDIRVIMAGDLAVIRYQSQIDIDVQGQNEFVRCWHTDCYRRGGSGWQAYWSQATIAGPGRP